MKTLKELSYENKIFIAAHRGASAVAPESSIAAFRESMRVGADMIEIDIQFTKDDKIIVYHDYEIELNNNKKNSSKKISEMNFSELQDYDIGEKYHENFAGEKIPQLEEVFEIIKNKIYAIIEIKPKFSEKKKSNLTALYKTIKKYDMLEYVVVSSFDIENIKYLKSLDNKLFTAAIYYSENKISPNEYKLKTGCEAFICDIEELDEKNSQNAKNNNIFVGVYGVNDKTTFSKAIKYKVSVIGTDDPQRIKSFMSNLLLV